MNIKKIAIMSIIIIGFVHYQIKSASEEFDTMSEMTNDDDSAETFKWRSKSLPIEYSLIKSVPSYKIDITTQVKNLINFHKLKIIKRKRSIDQVIQSLDLGIENILEIAEDNLNPKDTQLLTILEKTKRYFTAIKEEAQKILAQELINIRNSIQQRNNDKENDKKNLFLPTLSLTTGFQSQYHNIDDIARDLLEKTMPKKASQKLSPPSAQFQPHATDQAGLSWAL